MLDIQSLLDLDGFIVQDEDDFDNGGLDVETVAVHAQFILDGASTLTEAADAARAYADFLDGLVDNGYELTAPIQDDRGFATLNY